MTNMTEMVETAVEMSFVEENEAEGILNYRTVNLPLLLIGGEKIAQGHPPSRTRLQRCWRGTP